MNVSVLACSVVSSVNDDVNHNYSGVGYCVKQCLFLAVLLSFPTDL